MVHDFYDVTLLDKNVYDSLVGVADGLEQTQQHYYRFLHLDNSRGELLCSSKPRSWTELLLIEMGHEGGLCVQQPHQSAIVGLLNAGDHLRVSPQHQHQHLGGPHAHLPVTTLRHAR